MAWSNFDELDILLDKKIESIKHDYGDGKIIITFSDETELLIKSVIDEKNTITPIANLYVQLDTRITKEFTI